MCIRDSVLVIPKGAYVDMNDFAANAKSEEIEGLIRALGKVASILGVSSSGYRYLGNNKWEIFTHGGRNSTGIDAIEYSKIVEKNGAGEILLTSMDKDGTKTGYDLELTRDISNIVSIPVIASGGVGNLDHLYEGFNIGLASAVLAASIFHYGEYSIMDAKNYLIKKGIPIRI